MEYAKDKNNMHVVYILIILRAYSVSELNSLLIKLERKMREHMVHSEDTELNDVVYSFTGMSDSPMMNLGEYVRGEKSVQDFIHYHFYIMGVYEAFAGGDEEDSNPTMYAGIAADNGRVTQRVNTVTIDGTTGVSLPFYGKIKSGASLGFILKRTKMIGKGNSSNLTRYDDRVMSAPLQLVPWNLPCDTFPPEYAPIRCTTEGIMYIDDYVKERMRGIVYTVGQVIFPVTIKHPRVSISDALIDVKEAIALHTTQVDLDIGINR